MSDFIEVITSNMLYVTLLISLLGILIFFVFKKMTKLFLYAAVVLIVFLAYVYYTGESVNSTIEPVQKAVEKAEQTIK